MVNSKNTINNPVLSVRISSFSLLFPFLFSVVKKCHFNPQTDDDYFCKCKVNEDGKLIDAQCDRCKLAVDVGDEPPEDAKCDTKPEPSDCHYHGTQSITDSGECQCKVRLSNKLYDF
ncbi:unnamed protein product [Trichobilharzia regenti]|nr:unnamed protein product [Trichobilharzia regenti]